MIRSCVAHVHRRSLFREKEPRHVFVLAEAVCLLTLYFVAFPDLLTYYFRNILFRYFRVEGDLICYYHEEPVSITAVIALASRHTPLSMIIIVIL
jgi:hypothetical protein